MSAKVEIDSKITASKAIISDIEGTTTSISFVKDTLFPYAEKNVECFLKENFSNDDVKAAIVKLREQSAEDVKLEVEGVVAIVDENATEEEQIASMVKNVQWQMSIDRKTGALKTLQGLIYQKGYKDGTIKAHVYEDVPKAFEQWTSTGHKLYIYSSGSVDAQKLLFAHTEHGDLSAHIAGYFDTNIGAKQESKSYAAIAKEIDFAPEEIVFLTDIVKEAEAAKETGMNVVLLVRPGNADLTDDEKAQYATVETFADIPFEAVGGVKRKIDDVTPEQQEEVPSKVAKADEVSKSAEPNEADVAVESTESKVPAEEKPSDAVEKMEVDSTEVEATEKMDQTEKETKKPVVDNEAVVEKVESSKETADVIETVEKTDTLPEKVKEIIPEKVEKTKSDEPVIDVDEIAEEAKEIESTDEKKSKEVKEAEPKIVEKTDDVKDVVEKVGESAEAESTTQDKPVNEVVESTTETKSSTETVDSSDKQVTTENKVAESNGKKVVDEPALVEQNGHTNGDSDVSAANGHVENGKKVEEKTEEITEEIKAKKVLDAEPEAVPPVEVTEA